MTEADDRARTAKQHLVGGKDPALVAKLLAEEGADALQTTKALRACGLSLTEAKAAIDGSGCWPERAEFEAQLFDMMMCGLALEEMMGFLAQHDYAGMVAHCFRSRLTAADIESAVHDYGRTIIEPPDEAYDYADTIAIEAADDSTYSVNMPVWTAEEGRSDLTLQLTVGWRQATPDKPYTIHIDLDDLHVL